MRHTTILAVAGSMLLPLTRSPQRRSPSDPTCPRRAR